MTALLDLALEPRDAGFIVLENRDVFRECFIIELDEKVIIIGFNEEQVELVYAFDGADTPIAVGFVQVSHDANRDVSARIVRSNGKVLELELRQHDAERIPAKRNEKAAIGARLLSERWPTIAFGT